jgi:hypothetical protein
VSVHIDAALLTGARVDGVCEIEGIGAIDNLMLLCPTHHRLFHEGGYTIDAHGDGMFTFRTPDGRAIEPPPLRAGPDATPTASGVPRASDGGGRYDLGLTLDALLT